MRRTSFTMDRFCLLYLLLILLMRSGDVETNPGPNTAESTVSEMEFLKLAQDIDPSYYYNLGISLGFSHAQLLAILIENSKNFKDAFMDVFMKWNVKQQPLHSNKRQLLADKLRDIDLGGLSDRLLNGPPIPNSTGGPSRLLDSQTKPLSPELVERCANDFKFKYRSTLCKIRTDPLNPASTVRFDAMYTGTNLFFQEDHGTKKRKLVYNDILDLKVNGEFPKRIMVQGEAGAGKTTLCAKIAWDWIEGRHYSHFVWVLIVPLHEFQQHTIGEIAKSYLGKGNPATVSQITEYIRSNPNKVFIAFDGLDAVGGKIIKTESHQSQPTAQMQLQLTQPSVTSSEACGSSSETDDIGLVDILCSDQLASCPVLVTARPWRAVEIRSDGDLMKLYTFIHVEGFNRENLSVYIHKYFPKNEDLANRLIQFTSENDVVSENMAHYPIYVAMLCLMWKKRDKQKLKEMKSMKTFSQIFKEIIAFLKEHYAQKEVRKVGSPSLIAYLKEIDELLGPIAKQALNGLLENTLVFSEEDFQMCPESKDTACRVGILSQEDRITTSMDMHERNSHVQLPVFFPHKLFQEYMAGVHLASLYESDRNEFNRLIEQVVLPRMEELRYLLYFTVSQNKRIATHVMKSMLQELNMEGWEDLDIDFIVDVAFESQDPDVAALVKDRVSSEEIELTISRDITAHTVAGFAFIGPHVVKLCVERDCGPTMSLDVAEIICSIPSLKEASLLGAFHHCFFETLARKAEESKITKLCIDCNLRGNDPKASRDLAKFLCRLPSLTDLTMRESYHLWLHDDFYHELALLASSSKNYFFNKKLHLDEKSEEFRQMDLGQQREHIRHLLHPTFAIPPNLDVPSTSGISVQSDKIPEVPADIDTGIQEAIRKGEAPWNRSRIMVIGPAGVGKTSLIRRLTGQKFNPEEKSTKGAEQNVVTKSAISSWILVNDTQTAKDDIIQSIAMDPNYGSNRPCSSGGEENRSDPEITKRRGVELEHDQETSVNSVSEVAGRSESPGTKNVESPHTLDETPSTSSQPMIKENVASTPEHRHIAESDIEELTESRRIGNRESGSNQSTLGKGSMSEATKTNVAESNIKVLPTSDNKKIAKILQGITREKVTKVKSSASDITYSMWDFGGQEIYYITHPLFLSWRSLYILVIPLHLELSDKAPRGEDAENAKKQLKGSAVRTHHTILELVHFWLMSVYTYAVPDSHHEPKVLLMGTFAGDEGPEIIGEKVKNKFQELKKQLGSKPYWKQVLFPMCGIDNQFSQECEVNKIQARIDGLIKDSAYMKVLMPIKWRTFLIDIEDSDRNTLTVPEAHSTMKTLGINDLKEVKAILKFYHDIGHLIYHEGCELIVLKPQFLNSIVSNIITVMDDKTMEENLAKYWRDLSEKGILSIELIEAVWEQHKGDHDQLNDIIDMMITFDLICEIPDRPAGRGFFVPCRSSPMLDEKECHDKDNEVKFTIDFNHFLPDGFLHRFYVRMAKWSMERKESIKPIFHCRQMVFYIDNRHRVVMTNEIHSKERHQIKVAIYAVTPAGAPSGRTKARVSLNENIIDHVHETLEVLKKLWARRIEYSVGILCPKCSECDVKALIPIRDILKCPEDSASCDELCSIYVGHILKAFNKDIGTTRRTAESQATGVSTLSEYDQESDLHYPTRTLPLSDHPQQQPMVDVEYPRRTLPPSDHPQQQPMGDVHYPRRTLPPSDHPQQQPMGDVHYPRRTLPSSDHPQQQPMGDVHSPRRTLPSSDHPPQQTMGDVHYPRSTLPPSDHPQQQPMAIPPSAQPQQQQPMGDVHYPRMVLPSSDHPQQQAMGDIHSTRRTLLSSDHAQQHIGNTSDTVFQLSQTHSDGGSSRSRPDKRQAPSSQSRVPQDDPEIPEKQAKYEV